jgi:hypothetical protein
MLSLVKNFATGIGSLPYKDVDEACSFILSCFKKDSFFWPQLPKRSFLEQMVFQFSENLPGRIIDQEQRKISINTQKDSFAEELESCFMHYLNKEIDYFAISEDYAPGLYALIKNIIKNKMSPSLIKGQIVGPITFGMMLLTEEQQPAIYHPELKEAIVKLLCMKAIWQIRKLEMINNEHEKPQVIIFIDEPFLSSFGTSFFTLKKEEVISNLNEVIEAIHSQNAFCGIHCCANTDWSVILSTNLDILSFDAYGYLDNLFLYTKELDSFLDRGGVLSFGIVPNNEEAEKDDKKEELILRLKEVIKNKNKIGKILVTASCGCGTLDVALSERINRLCAEIAQALP